MSLIKYELYRNSLTMLATLYGPEVDDDLQNDELEKKVQGITTPEQWKVEWDGMFASKDPPYNVYYVLIFWYVIRKSRMTRHKRLTTELNAMMSSWSCLPSNMSIIHCLLSCICCKPWRLAFLFYWPLIYCVTYGSF